MPLFKVGSFGQIGVTTSQIATVIKVEHKDKVKFPRVLSIDAMREASFNIEPPKIDLAKSEKKWGLFLKNLSLYESFEGFIANLFVTTQDPPRSGLVLLCSITYRWKLLLIIASLLATL
jgi:hypothetical protein